MDPSFLLTTVCPIVGVALASIQFSSSIKPTLEARRVQNMGSINPTPLAVTLVVCITRIVYGCMVPNPYLVLSVFCGLPVSFFACSTAFTLLGRHKRQNAARNMEKILLPSFSLLILLSFFNSFGLIDPSLSLNIFGFLSMSSTMVYFMAPLSAIFTIIKKKNADSLYLPAVAITVLNTSVWTLYSVSIWDIYVVIPSVSGLTLSLCQLSVKLHFDGVFPKEKQLTFTATVNDKGTEFTKPNNARCRRASFDGGGGGSHDPISVQYLELSSHDSREAKSEENNRNTRLGTDNHSTNSSSSGSERDTDSPATVNRESNHDIEQGPVSERVPQCHSIVLIMLSEMLEPFNPDLTKQAIMQAEENGPLHVPYRDGPVTISGVIYDIACSIPDIVQSRFLPHIEETMPTRTRSTSYGMAKYTGSEKDIDIPDINSSAQLHWREKWSRGGCEDIAPDTSSSPPEQHDDCPPSAEQPREHKENSV